MSCLEREISQCCPLTSIETTFHLVPLLRRTQVLERSHKTVPSFSFLQVPWRFTTSTFWMEKPLEVLKGEATCQAVQWISACFQWGPYSVSGTLFVNLQPCRVISLPRWESWGPGVSEQRSELERSPSDPLEGCKRQLTMLFPWDVVSGLSSWLAFLGTSVGTVMEWWFRKSRKVVWWEGPVGWVSHTPSFSPLQFSLLQVPSDRSQECYSTVTWSQWLWNDGKSCTGRGSSSLAPPFPPWPYEYAGLRRQERNIHY